ncbi:MAG: hypothetical protein HYV97_01515 [Bdellovibrio sp.]|nr:hypothetical protein [Bdellovibrio sp.]
MPHEPKLEQYLANLDKALGQIPVSDRADIITEIKSHILESVERNPDQGLDQTLAALGEPETVANRYLLERGLRPGRPTKSPMVKWLTIGFLGTLGMILLFLIILVWKFSPIIKVDEKNDRVTILGGLIDVNGNAGTVRVGETFSENDDAEIFDGAKDLAGTNLNSIYMAFRNGKLNVFPAVDTQLRWSCKARGEKDKSFLLDEGNKIILNFAEKSDVKCDLHIPAGVTFVVEGTNGKLNFEYPHFRIDVRLTNGDITFIPAKDKKYKFDTNIVNGKIGGLDSSSAEDALLVKFSLTNGNISGL